MTAVELLTYFNSQGIRLKTDGSRIGIPKGLAPEIVEAVRQHKSELLAMLKPRPTVATTCGRCGSSVYTDVVIHGGRSKRRNCARCGQFICFPVWYGRSNQQPS